MQNHLTPDELEAALGESIRALRLDLNLAQEMLADRAGVSVRAVKNLEGGLGSTLRSLVCIVRELGRADWLTSVAPVASINPLTMPRSLRPRKRASRRRAGKIAP